MYIGSASVIAHVCSLFSPPSTYLVGLLTHPPPRWLQQTSSSGPLALTSPLLHQEDRSQRM